MNLAKRLNITVALTAVAAVLLSAIVARFVVLASFEAQEQLTNAADIERVKAALDAERRRILGLVSDWAAWDDAYAFMEYGNPEFVRSNLVEEVFEDPLIGLDAIVFLDNQGAVRAAGGVSWVTAPDSTFVSDIAATLRRAGHLGQTVTGFARRTQTEPPFVYATRPIHRSNGSGQRRGTLVMVRCLSSELVALLGTSVQHHLSLVPWATPAPASRTLSHTTLETHVPITDASGKAVGALRFSTERTAYLRGERTALVVLIVAMVAILVASLFAHRLLQNGLVKRIQAMVETISGIRESGDLSTRLSVSGNDEITQLAIQTNGMLGRLDEQNDAVLRLERFEAQNQMSAGINHNLNNLLTGVIGGAELLLRANDDPTVRQRAEAIRSSGQQAGDLVARLNSLFDLSRQDVLSPVDLNDAVRQAIRDSAPQWRDDAQARGVTITVSEQLQDGLPPIHADRSGIYNSVLNLILNALNAMPDGGRLTLSTDSREDEVELRVRDEGVGMDSATRRHIFDPFFTTNPDVGRGLGLATVMSTVIQCKGSVEVLSAPGRGAEFRLRFPQGEAISRTPDEPPPVTARRGRILVADDQAYIGTMLYDLLGNDHDVKVFNDARRAADAVTDGPWDIAILDLGMPGLPGHELAVRVRRAWPDACLILLTGWDLAQDDPRLRPFDHHLRKPIDNLASLQALVARVLTVGRPAVAKAHPA